jgi:hypothetical protein
MSSDTYLLTRYILICNCTKLNCISNQLIVVFVISSEEVNNSFH